MSRFVLSRRTALRGAGGLALALPPLEIMSRSRAAQAAPAPKRFVMAYAGSSLGGERGASMGAAAIVTPTTPGLDYQPPIAFQPLADPAINVKSEVTIVTGLKVPWGATPPAAGRVVNFHSYTTIPQTTGMRVQKNATENATGPSADQIVAETLSVGTLQKSMVLKVQPVNYLGAASGQRGRISFDKAGRRMEPVGSPHAVYDALFSGFTAPAGMTDPTKPVMPAAPPPDLVRRKSIMDFVHGETERLLPRLGRVDRERLEKHFDHIRDIERQIMLLSASGGGTSAAATSRCMKPADFMDPAVTSNSKPGYNNEELRGKLMSDLIHMAFACDRTRVVSLVYTFAQCYMSCASIIPSKNGSDLHEIGHGAGNVADHAYAVAWNVRQFATLVSKLRSTPDVDGKTLLDNSVLLLLFEGGWGFDPEGARMWSAHSTERMAVLVGGGRGAGIKHKGHLVAQDKHPAQVVLAGMNAVGVQGALGEVTTGLPELFA